MSASDYQVGIAQDSVLVREGAGEPVREQVIQSRIARPSRLSIEVRLILRTLRHFSAEQSLVTAQLVDRFGESYVGALTSREMKPAFA